MIPSNIHRGHKGVTNNRRDIEYHRIFDPANDSFVIRNKTNFTAGDNIETYYERTGRDNESAYLAMLNNYFPPELSKDTIMTAQQEALEIQKNDFIADR